MTPYLFIAPVKVKVLVFKTDIRFLQDVRKIAVVLNDTPGIVRWNVDREDIDNVLRIESGRIEAQEVIAVVRQAGYYCEELPD